MTALSHRLREDLPRRGLAPRTPQCYIEAVKHLSQHYRRAPDQITDEESRQDLLSRLHEKQVAERTCRLHLYGSRFFMRSPDSDHGRSGRAFTPGTAENCPLCCVHRQAARYWPGESTPQRGWVGG